MPTWTSNTLHLVGDSDKIDAFYEMMGDEFDFGKIVPSPENLFTENLGDKERKMCEEKGIPNWLDWNCEHWGTKWGDCNTQLVDEDYDSTFVESFGKVMLNFDSAWGPPHEGMVYIASIFPRWLFDLRYYEPGMCFQGFLVLHNGKVAGINSKVPN